MTLSEQQLSEYRRQEESIDLSART
ncbi:MAG: hypothetical protein QOJ82_2568, partial [Solirubrobacteraceae bacterium]|nr:hypothetical protein [Solirubrobacteraceae bacterium]